jgi:thymidylate synthase (FAD)
MNKETSTPFGFVRLDAHMADDLSVANAARVSFARYSTQLGGEDIALIEFLMRERHGTPFEHNSFRFHVKCPLFVAREWFRHRIGSFNEFSARYSPVENHFYVPSEEDVRKQIGKPGYYSFEPVDPKLSKEAVETIAEHYQHAYGTYTYLMSMGVAKELARTVLPVGMYTQFYWTVNARSLMNFLSLRTAKTAQKEIRDYADEVEKIFKDKMPYTHEAWVANGKICP